MIPGRSAQHTQVPADLPRLYALAVRLGLRESIDHAALALSEMEGEEMVEVTRVTGYNEGVRSGACANTLPRLTNETFTGGIDG